MSEHTPQHHSPVPVDPDPSGADPTLIDQVAGDPPVPITVWRTARTAADAHRSIGARLAYRLISAYSHPGEAVVDLTTDHALSAVCAAGRRQHHPGWFTDASSLIIGPATPVAEPDTDRGERLELGAWFGDDLTDPDLPASAGAVPAPSDGASLQATTSLVVACWPLDAGDAANRVRLAWLLSACAQLLRPGGCLVLVVGVPTGTTAAPEDLSPLATAAANVGLGYLQHIVAVAADTDADAFLYHVTDEELLTLARESDGQQWVVAHLRVHADLLVFSKARTPDRAPRARRRRSGGDHHG
ncbi:MAG TPA: hypothetical protein VF755_28725 [Catenuloplanes sp.]